MTYFEGCYQPLSRTAIRFPCCSVRMWLRRVVLPAPRYPNYQVIRMLLQNLEEVGEPVTIVMGTLSRLSNLRLLVNGSVVPAVGCWASTSSGISSSSLRFAITKTQKSNDPAVSIQYSISLTQAVKMVRLPSTIW